MGQEYGDVGPDTPGEVVRVRSRLAFSDRLWLRMPVPVVLGVYRLLEPLMGHVGSLRPTSSCRLPSLCLAHSFVTAKRDLG